MTDSVTFYSSTDIAPQQQTNVRFCPAARPSTHPSTVEFQPMQVSAQLGINTAHEPIDSTSTSSYFLLSYTHHQYSTTHPRTVTDMEPLLRSRSQECGSFSPRRPHCPPSSDRLYPPMQIRSRPCRSNQQSVPPATWIPSIPSPSLPYSNVDASSECAAATAKSLPLQREWGKIKN